MTFLKISFEQSFYGISSRRRLVIHGQLLMMYLVISPISRLDYGLISLQVQLKTCVFSCGRKAGGMLGVLFICW